MATVRQLEIPDELEHALERRAAANAISVEAQILQDLSLIQSEMTGFTEPELLEEVRRSRQAMAKRGINVNDEFIAEAKAWGRK